MKSLLAILRYLGLTPMQNFTNNTSFVIVVTVNGTHVRVPPGNTAELPAGDLAVSEEPNENVGGGHGGDQDP